MAPLALARECRGFGECLGRGPTDVANGLARMREETSAGRGPWEAAPTWPQSQGMGAWHIPSAAVACGRCCKAVTDGPYSSPVRCSSWAQLGDNNCGAEEPGLAQSPWNCNISRLASPASIWLGLDQQLLTASGETLCTRRGMGCTVS